MVDPISIISAVDLCFKYGTKLVHLCSAVAHAKEDIKERSLRVETYWMRTELQLNVVRGIASELSKKHRMIQHATITILVTQLEIAINNVESTIKSYPDGDQELEVHRWKYALMKEKIDRTIEDLKEWQSLFDPSWYLIMKLADRQIDDDLRKNRISSAMKFQDPIPPAQSLRIALHLTDAYTPSRRWAGGQKMANRLSWDELNVLQPLMSGTPRSIYKISPDGRLTGSDAMKFDLLSRKGYTQQD